MKIRRFTGVDMRDALRQVRNALGTEAVILETAHNATGVEISAAVDGDATPVEAISPDWTDSRTTLSETDEGPCVVIGGTPRGRTLATVSEMDQMREEMRSIRSLLEAQLGRLIWDDQSRQTPQIAGLLRNFTQLGLDADIARRLAERSAVTHPAGGWTAVLRTMVEELPVADTDPVSDGGTYAVIGPTGVGKTTTIAKLAARAALEYGPDSIGLVTTDTFRVAAREQLDTYGQIIGIPVSHASDAQSLGEALAALRNRRLVLIDTAGLSQRDPRLPEQLARLGSASSGITTLLALSANGHAGAMQEIVDVFRTARPAACILTKTDEAMSLGGALSVLIRSQLALAYVANGQRVPEDLHLMRNRQSWLAKMAVELMRRENRVINTDEMAGRFTEVATHAYA
ncbi:MAG: flagellar biosynthesis protein FlhF [Gammaproteobacteria bacterium]|nr:flagellar biosynthesis protein FlhF [Gammaproteobacteria bacterium]